MLRQAIYPTSNINNTSPVAKDLVIMLFPCSSLLFALIVGTASAALPSRHNATWTTLKNVPRLRQEHTTVAIKGDTIAVIGGVTPIGNATQFTGIRTVDWVHLYDIPSDTWRTATPSPFRVNHPNVISKDGLVYLLGGLVDARDPPDTLPYWIASGECHVYDPDIDVWSQLESMPPGTERGSAVMGVHDDLIYLAGGMTILGGKSPGDSYQDAVITVTAFNTTSGEWLRLVDVAANIPEGRQHAAGGVIGNVLYVAGGRWFEKSNLRDEVFMLDLGNQSAGWTTADERMPTARGGISGAVVNQKLFTFGGEANPDTKNGIFDNVEVFDTDARMWTSLAPMQVPRHGTSAVAIGNKIYIPGGGLQEDGKIVIIDGVEQFIRTTDHFDVLTV